MLGRIIALLKRRSVYRSSGRKSSGLSVFAVIFLVAALASGGWFVMRDLSGPSIAFEHAENVGVAQALEIMLEDRSGIQYAKVTVRRSDHSEVVYENKFAVLEKKQRISFDLKPLKMPEGAFQLEVEARDGSFAIHQSALRRRCRGFDPAGAGHQEGV